MSGSWGNWGSFTHIRSRASQRRRIALTIASLVAGVVLVVVATNFGAGGEIGLQVAVILGLLVLGVLFGLRPWARD